MASIMAAILEIARPAHAKRGLKSEHFHFA
jgi:hypothetical protein